MRKWIIFLIVIVMLVSGIYFRLQHVRSERLQEAQKAEEQRLNSYVELRTRGGSMTDYGIPGDADHDIMQKLYYNQECKVGDNCAFKCYKKECLENTDHLAAVGYDQKSDHIGEIKHLVKQDGDCYWFEGNKNHWQENGQWYTSSDSRKYGWLCGDDLKIDGVVK